MTEPTEKRSRNWSWSQLLGAAGVALSLIFVATEIQQNTDAVKGSTFQALSDARIEMLMAINDDADLAEAFAAWQSRSDDWSSLSPAEQGKVRVWLGAYFAFLDNAYYQVSLGALPRSAFETWMMHPNDPAFPRVGEFVTLLSSRFTPEFREYLEAP